MADAIVSLAVERISDLLINEALFLKDVKEQVESLRDELKRMHCFLEDVDRQPEQDKRLRNRVSEIRDLALDAEDVIDSFTLKAAHQRGFHGVVKRFTSIFTKPFHLHKLGVQVKEIQTKLENISKSLPAYEIPGDGAGSSSVSSMQQRLRRTFSHVEEEDVVSLEVSTKDVLVLLMTEEDRTYVVVSIVGMGGIGKTTIARKVYNHVDVKRRFDCLAWASISQQCNQREVLHDVLMKDWNILKPAFPRGRKGSKILFTTRNKDVALHADPCNSPIELPFLTDDQSWKLFIRKAFPQDKTDPHACPRAFEKFGREMEHLERAPTTSAVNAILAFSYNDLPYYLKPCFLYLGHYQEDWEIPKKDLIRLWITEGFISSSPERSDVLMEDVDEHYLQELVNRSLVQVGRRDHTGTNVKTCRMRDLLRDLCIKKSREENFLEVVVPPSTESSVTLAEHMLRRIVIHPRKRSVCVEGEHQKLRSLLLFGNEAEIQFDISKCKNFKFLRVLSLGSMGVDKWHVSSEIGNLSLLRYLKLYCRSIILPRSIGRLKSLHTLYIRYVRYVRIPDVVSKLERLRHIVLHTPLYRSSRIGFGLRFRPRTEDVKSILMSLRELQRLASLSMVFSDRGSIPWYPNLEPLSQCEGLSKLKLYGGIKADPKESHHVLKCLPPSIVKLTLSGCKMRQDPMGVVEKLPCLRVLILEYNPYVGSKMICSANGFPQLHSLTLEYLGELEEWEIEEGAMPHLQSLCLWSISKLKMIPEGLRYITTLQQLELRVMKTSLEQRIENKDGEEGQDFYKVRHIPHIQII
ncbi:hypothetical protein V6N13_092065 [Hibiscus sabdariffa]